MSIRIKGDRRLKTLSGLATRPTPSKVRSAVFNIWQWRLSGAKWLDLCTGSGAMAAEALMRGASSVVGIEQSVAACKLIQTNWQAIAQPNQVCHIYCGDVIKTLPKLLANHGQFDLIYFDPPYQSDLYEPVLTAIAALMTTESAIAVEHSRDRTLPEIFYNPNTSEQNLEICDRRQYGQTALTFYQIPDQV